MASWTLILLLAFFPNLGESAFPPFLRPSANIKRNGPPFFLIQPMPVKKSPRLVLTLPKDNIQILNADRGSHFLPLTLTDSEDGMKGTLRFGSSRSYSSHVPSPPRQASSRYHYGFLPFPQSEEDEKPSRWGDDMDDLIGSSGGHVTFIKAAHKPAKSSFKPMKAIIIEPKEIQAKRVHVMEAETEKVSATKARLIGSKEPMISHAIKANVRPLSYKKGVLKGEDWAASNIHVVKAEPPPQEGSMKEPPMELQCGGTNDLGWCDLGANYPSAEVSEIMEMCDELMSRMFVEVPEDTAVMEDIAPYSLSRNVSQGSRPPRKAHANKPLCEINREFIRPSFAQDMKGKWHVIIQTEAFPQRIALEVCKNPGSPCSSNDLCSNSRSQCVQKYSHHQLISFDPESAETCPYVRLYKFPTSCVCRVQH